MNGLEPWAPVEDAGALVARLRAVRGDAGARSTNWFADPRQAGDWVARRRLVELALPGCVLVLRRERDFHHVYHAAESFAALESALRSDELAGVPGALVADLVDRPATLAPVVHAYAAAGFAPYRMLVRLARARDAADATPPSAAASADHATVDDVGAVVAFFERLLDPFVDQLPGYEEIEALVRGGTVLLVRHEGTLGGVLVYELRGQTAILRYWWVDEAARGAGVGARLIRTMFHECRSAARIVLWVVEGNENAIMRYEHYGFRREGLVDQLMLRHRNEHR